MEQAEAERDALTGELAALKAQMLAELTAQDEQKRADQQVRPGGAAGRGRRRPGGADAEVAAHEAEVDDSDGILARLTALDRLGEGDPMLATAH